MIALRTCLLLVVGVSSIAPGAGQAGIPDVESEILVRLDLSSLDLFFLEEPFRSAFATASVAEVRLRFRAFGWEAEHLSRDGRFADFWTYAAGTMGYELRVGGRTWRGSNSTSFDPPWRWSHVIFGSFPSAPGATAFWVSVGDGRLRLRVRSEELPGAEAIYRRSWLHGQRFPAYNEDFLAGFVDRLVVEIAGVGTTLLFTGSAFAHADPILGVEVTPARPVAVEAESWSRLKSLYQE